MSTGPLLGGLLGHFGWRFPFFATSLLMFLAFALTLFLVKEPQSAKQKPAGLKDFVGALSYRPFFLVALTAMLYYYAFFTVLAYSPLLLKLDAVQLGLIFFGWGVCLGIGSTKGAHGLLNRYPAASVSRLGLLLMAITLLLILIIPNHALRIAIIIGSGFVSGINNTTFSSFAIETSLAQRSIASGAYNFVRWLGAAIAPVVSGFAAGLLPTAPYAIAMILVIVGLLVMVASGKRFQHKPAGQNQGT
jgi:predicted MFS family arabinose efflux permease